MRARREEESSTNSTKLSKASKTKVEEVSLSKDVHHEVLLTHKTLLQTLHVEHPSYLLLCHVVLTYVSNILHLRIYLLLSVLFSMNLRIFSLRMAPKASHLLKEYSTKLILS